MSTQDALRLAEEAKRIYDRAALPPAVYSSSSPACLVDTGTPPGCMLLTRMCRATANDQVP